MNQKQKRSFRESLGHLKSVSAINFESFVRRYNETLDRFNLDSSADFFRELNSIVSEESTADMSHNSGSAEPMGKEVPNALAEEGAGRGDKAGEVGCSHGQSSRQTEYEDLHDKIERTLIEHQMRVFEQIKEFKDQVNKRLDGENRATYVPREPDPIGNPFSSPPPQLGNFSALSIGNSRFQERVCLDKWHINYDGTSSIGDFLFKVEYMQRSSGLTDEQMTANVHVLLSGEANKWYWRYLRRKPNARFEEMKAEMHKEFGRPENDIDIYMRLLTRKQGYKESFDEFYNAIVSLNDRMKEPFDDKKLISVLRNNARDKLGEILLSSDAKSVEQLRLTAREVEKFLAKRYIPKVVHEIEVENETKPVEYNSQNIAAISFQAKTANSTNFACWNCNDKSHSFYFCPSHVRTLFCFLCGAKGVTTLECPKQHSENFRRDERKGEENRPSENLTSLSKQ